MKTSAMPLEDIVKALGYQNVTDIKWSGRNFVEYLTASNGHGLKLEITIAWKCTGCNTYHTGDCASI